MDRVDFHEDLCQLVSYLTSALTNMNMYPSDHPQVRSSLEQTHAHLLKIFKARREITVALLKDHLISDDRPLIPSGSQGDAFIDILKKSAVDRITLIAGISFRQLEQFIGDFVSSDKSIRSTRFIKVGKVKLKDDGKTEIDRDSEISDADAETIIDIGSTESNETIRDVYDRIKVDGAINVDIVEDIVMAFWENIHKGGTPLSMLASLKSADEYTYTHAVNVSILTMHLAESIGMSGSILKDIGVAAVLHDIGKVLIPEDILLKAGSLTPDERTVVESHTVKGARYLLKMKSLPKLAALVALEHHMRYDGGGYPQTKGKWKTNIVSQMISIADVFDALRTRRPYREPMSPDEIEAILRREGGMQFNPFLLPRFCEITKR